MDVVFERYVCQHHYRCHLCQINCYIRIVIIHSIVTINDVVVALCYWCRCGWALFCYCCRHGWCHQCILLSCSVCMMSYVLSALLLSHVLVLLRGIGVVLSTYMLLLSLCYCCIGMRCCRRICVFFIGMDVVCRTCVFLSVMDVVVLYVVFYRAWMLSSYMCVLSA